MKKENNTPFEKTYKISLHEIKKNMKITISKVYLPKVNACLQGFSITDDKCLNKNRILILCKSAPPISKILTNILTYVILNMGKNKIFRIII